MWVDFQPAAAPPWFDYVFGAPAPLAWVAATAALLPEMTLVSHSASNNGAGSWPGVRPASAAVTHIPNAGSNAPCESCVAASIANASSRRFFTNFGSAVGSPTTVLDPKSAV